MSLAMISWGIAWTNAKIVGEYLSFNNLIFFRFLLGFLSLLPIIIFTKKPFPKYRVLGYIIIPSFLFYFYNIAFFKGTFYGLAGKGGVLVTTLNPLCTIIIVGILNQKIRGNEILGMLFGIVGGMIIMELHSEGLDAVLSRNNYYFIICAITWGIMTVSISYSKYIIDPYVFICLCYLFTTIIAFPSTDLKNINLANLDMRFYINFFLVSIGAMSFGTSIYMYSTNILGPTKVSVFIFSVPFIAMSTSYFVLYEPFTFNIAIGGILSLLSIYIVNR